MSQFVIRTEEEFKIISDPFRLRIIKIFSEMPDMTATSKQIADILNENSSKVTYHLKMLLKIGVIEFDHTEVINGINAKYYRLLFDSFDTKFDMANEMELEIFRKNYLGLFSGVVQEFLKELQELDFDKNKSYRGSMAFEKLWLTEEDFEKAESFVMTLIESHKEKNHEKEKFLFFSALMQMNKDKN